MAGYLKLKNPIQNNKLKEKLLSQKFTGMLKELAPIKHSINKSRDALISCINDTIKSKNCPVFSELPVKESKTKESKSVKATDTVNVKTAVTKKPIQEKEEASTDVKTDIIEKAESADAVKKGIEIYSVCGKEFTGNQSKMMTDAMKKQLEKAMLCYNNVNNSDSSENVAAIARKQGLKLMIFCFTIRNSCR